MSQIDSDVNVRKLILVPAMIALSITIIRLLGELGGGSSALFNRAAGGGGALVGIVWLVPIFGAYFAVKLAGGGHEPVSAGRVVGFSVLGLGAGSVIMGLTVALTGDPNVSLSLPAAALQQVGLGIAALVAILIQRNVWPAFFRTMLSYAFASRIPVVIVMFLAMMGEWGTHYELGPPGYPEMGFLTEFVLIAVMPQLTFWIMFTVVVGSLVGGVAACLVRSRNDVRSKNDTEATQTSA